MKGEKVEEGEVAAVEEQNEHVVAKRLRMTLQWMKKMAGRKKK